MTRKAPNTVEESPPPSTNQSNVGVSRSLFSTLNGMYTMAKSKLPSVATSPLKRIESGVSGLIERNVSPKLVSSLESRLDNLITPQITKLAKVAEFAQALGDRATPTMKRLGKNIKSTIEVIDRSKKRLGDLVENAKQVPQHLQDRATTIALDSIQRVNTVVDYILPKTEEADATVETKEESKDKEEDEKPLRLADGDIEEIVRRSVVISSKNLFGKVNKRIQKQVWQRVASAQGFMKRRTEVIHTSLMDYASTVMDHTVPSDVRTLYAAVLKFPASASEVYTELAGKGTVSGTAFRDALRQTMGSTWVEAMEPAALAYCEVVNRVLQAKSVALRARHTTATQAQQLLGHAASVTHNSFTVTTGRAAIVFTKVAPQALREAATAYLKRVDEATDLSVDDSFLRTFSSKIAAVVSLAGTDLHETCVRLYNPIKNKWESQANFDFGRSLMSLLTKVPTLNFSEVFGFFQALLSVGQIKKMRALASKTVTTIQSNMKQVVGDVVSPTSPPKKMALAKDVEQVCNDATSMVIPLDAIAEQVHTTLSNDGGTVDFGTFLSALRAEFEQASGKEWKSTLLSSARRIFSQLTNGEDEAQEVDEPELMHDTSSHSEEVDQPPHDANLVQ